MSARVKAIVTPSVLRWARESSGFSTEELARAVGTKPEKIQRWELGEDAPTLIQLRKLANKVKRPIAVFYLPEPPEDFQPLRDFRRLPGDSPDAESPQLRFEIRRSQYRQHIAIQLAEDLGISPPRFSPRATLSDDPERVGARVRQALGMTRALQHEWRQPYEIFNGWRTRLEQAGILVFQFSGVELSEARGFSLVHEVLPVVAVNVRDAPRGRVFSVLHELVHVVLRRGGLCDLETSPPSAPEENRIEIFCNHVAAAVLIPEPELLRDPIVSHHPRDTPWTLEELRKLSREFGASREAILRRLVVLGQATESEYRARRKEFLAQYRDSRAGAGGFVPPDRRALSHTGPLFARLVLRGYDQEKITLSRVSDYLEVKLKHLGSIRESLDRTLLAS